MPGSRVAKAVMIAVTVMIVFGLLVSAIALPTSY